MLWQYIITAISAVVFFGFVYWGVRKFGLLSCYSAYGMKWEAEKSKYGGTNLWQVITIVAPLLIVPAIVPTGDGSPWQFTAFLGPVSLMFVGATPDYAINKLQNVLHQIGAFGSAIFITLYVILIPKMLWVILAVLAALLVCALITGFKKTWLFWAEMAMYLSTYIVVFAII